jgi:hypothetical protein
MVFNLFGPPTKDDIRVGYIDPVLGLVEGVTICQANDYALKNPGTTFIFRNGNNVIQYLNINEVNSLDPNVLTSTDECGGINQRKECGPPVIQLFGGGGVGAAGNPVIGRDGALLAVDIVRGGNGYQYPPLVAARDNCNYGSGATLTAVLGEVTETIETYENEADFEDYEICNPTDVGYGRLYGPNGEDLGPWEPRLYTDPGEDPIRKEIEDYEQLVRILARKPFWTTRTSRPERITSTDTKLIPQRYDVTFPAWNEFMNKYAISPTSPSNIRGSDYSGIEFTFSWIEEFPIDGEYIFRGLVDNNAATADLYIDGIRIGNIPRYDDAIRPIQRTVTKGPHLISVELLNTIPDIQPPSTEIQSVGGYFHLKGRGYYLKVGGNEKVELSFNLAWSGTGDPSKTAVTRIVIPTEEGPPVILERTKQGNIFTVSGSASNSGIFQANKDYGPIVFEGTTGGTAPEIINSGDINVNPGTFQQSIIFQDSNDSNRDIDARLDIIGGSGIQLSGPRGVASSGTIVSSRSWNENPMGLALTIDAPQPPPPPQEQPLAQEGRCPSNPIWTTRFPGAAETWYPVRYTEGNLWSKFLNRYAISPVPPLDTPTSDTGGVLFKNSWDIDIPYDGFYKFITEYDDDGRVLLDGNLAFTFQTAQNDILKGLSDKVKSQKVFITKGRHTIGVELQNRKTETTTQINQKIFRTLDWQVAPITEERPGGSLFIKEGDAYYILIGGNDIVQIDFSFDWYDDEQFGYAVTKITIPTETGGPVVLSRPLSGTIGSAKATGTFRADKKYGPIIFEGTSSRFKDTIITDAGSGVGQRQQRISFYDNWADDPSTNADLTAVTGRQLSPARVVGGLTGGTAKDGVIYEGPPILHYQDNRWGSYMNKNSISPLIPGPVSDNGRKRFTWKNVRFPESGQYDVTFLADNNARLFIGERDVLGAQGFAENPQSFKVNVTQGTYDIVVDSEYPYDGPETNNQQYFNVENPTGFALEIRKNVSVIQPGSGKSWKENPMGIGAILIPPPCPRKIRGRGVVTDVIVNDPGNGYLRPIPQNQGYPVALRLKEVIVENPGINYNCGVDELQITPSNGAELDYVCDPFGKIREVKVLNPGLGFTEYPEIRMVSPPDSPTGPTGVNASFRPVFEVVRDPIALPERLIQVTDLVGLKQTGYVDGRPYYGAVYYDQGVRFAGFYETVGDPVRVYDTLQESITAQVTTPASAIERSGTDITSNDPRLNIPGTPQNLI